MPHRVLPSRSECRYCVSFFFYGQSVFPRHDVPPSALAGILTSLSPASSCSASSRSGRRNVIRDLFRKKLDDDPDETGREATLRAFMGRIRKNYAEVLCALIHTEEYYTSLAQAFSTTSATTTATPPTTASAGAEEEEAFLAVVRQVPPGVVREALLFFKSKCDELPRGVDEDFAEFVAAGREYLRGEIEGEGYSDSTTVQ
jgi:hypothetical protein